MSRRARNGTQPRGVGIGARNEPPAVGAEANEELGVAFGIARSEGTLEPAPPQVPDRPRGLVPAADREPMAIRAHGDRGHAVILPGIEGDRPGPGWMWTARVNKHDLCAGVVDDRQRSAIRQPAAQVNSLSERLSQSNSGGPIDIALGPARNQGGSASDKRPIYRGYDSTTIGIKEDRPALPGLQMGQLTAGSALQSRTPSSAAVARSFSSGLN